MWSVGRIGVWIFVWAACLEGAPTGAAPPELGLVQWRREYELAAAEAVQSGRSLLILFQEVPG